VRAILLLAFLGVAGIGLLALIPFAVRDMMTSDDLWWEWWENIDRLSALPIGLLIIGGAVILLARSAFLPDVTFDQQNRALLIGRGASERRIPFSDLSRVVIEPVQDRVGGLEVAVVRGDGERIKLGILSGSGMAEQAQGIALLIERITGAQAPPPDPGLGWDLYGAFIHRLLVPRWRRPSACRSRFCSANGSCGSRSCGASCKPGRLFGILHNARSGWQPEVARYLRRIFSGSKLFCSKYREKEAHDTFVVGHTIQEDKE
jgi:hypothetical protein